VDRTASWAIPVAHSKSPWIHARFAALTGEPVRYGKRLLPLDGFAAACALQRRRRPRLQRHRALQVRGRLAGQPAQRPGRAGGCLQHPALRRRHRLGDNTDGIGLVNDIQRNAGVRWRAATCCWSAPAARRPACWPACWKPGRAGGAGQPHARQGRRRWSRSTRTLAAALRKPCCWPLHLDGGPAPFDVVINATASSLAAPACRSAPAC
jgi:shikimate dehydrogenase